MFKKIKENPYYKKFKEMRADPKLRPVTSLIFWFIFIIFVLIFTKSTISSSPKVSTFKTTSNYEYTYKDDDKTIFGRAYNDKQEFIMDGKHYYYNGKVYLVDDGLTCIDNFDIGVLKITPELIDKLIYNTSYITIDDYKQYAVLLSNFINLYEFDTDVDLSLASQYNIIIHVFEKNNKIYKYKLDLGNYYRLRGLKDSGILTINIYNTGEDFGKYFESLGVIK